MAIKTLTIEGLRGFLKKTEINFSIPDGKNYGSGLTVLVGPNNSGKSTIIEAVHLLSSNSNIIPKSSRNSINKGIKIEAVDHIGHVYSLHSASDNSAFAERHYDGIIQDYWPNKLNTFILTNKRNFSSTFFNNNYQTREIYKSNIGDSEYRTENNINSNFGGRLLTISKNRNLFDSCLKKVVSPLPDWNIESSGNNNLYVEFSFNNIKHSSNGAGDGYINIFNIVDSLYDSNENNVILIDEPEISLHPDLQRKLFKLLIEYSKDKQIIVSTHSPYFVDWGLFANTAKIMRLKKESESIKLYQLSQETKHEILTILNDYQKPHTLSLNANEIFFLDDNVILTEGQDDVLCYEKIFEKYGFIPNASFFGWGAGGADRIQPILNILNDLGYNKVFVIVDNNKKSTIEDLLKSYPNYKYYAIETDDVRNKDRDKKITKLIKKINNINFDEKSKQDIIFEVENDFPNIEGLILHMGNFEINPKYETDILNLISNIKDYFSSANLEFPKNNKQILTDINDNYDDKNKASKLLENYMEDHKIFKLIRKKYNYLEFKGGGGGIISFQKIKNNTYYAIVENVESVSSKNEIIMHFHFLIKTKKEKVVLKSKKVISNTLPKK